MRPSARCRIAAARSFTTAAGDRRDEDIHRQAEIIGGFFDDVYIYEDQCTRGRADGEIIRMMREGMQRAKRQPRRILQKSGELPAIAAAISGLEPGDLLLCQVDQVDVALGLREGPVPPSRSSPPSCRSDSLRQPHSRRSGSSAAESNVPDSLASPALPANASPPPSASPI